MTGLRRCWFGNFITGSLKNRVVVVVVGLLAIASSPSFVSAQVMSLGNVFNGGWLSGVTLGDFKAGLSYGWGTISVTHEIAEGVDPQFGAFEPFEHRRDSDLSDIYMSVQCGLQGGGTEILALRLETNVGRSTNWKQTTLAGTGTNIIIGRPDPRGRTAVAVLYLPDDTEGEIILDNTNRRWDLEAVGAIPVATSFDVLLGYKAARNRSALAPYSARVPAGAFNQLPGITNWQNRWAVPIRSSTTGFTMTQYLSYNGPMIGVRLRDLILANPQRGGWHVDLLCAPFLFGTYEFEWNADANAPGNQFVNGKQTTHASGLNRFYVEARAEGRVDVSQACYLEISGRYSYLEMNGSEPQVQTASWVIGPFPVQSIGQTAEQTITMTQHFWNIGGNLVLPF